MPTLRLAGFHPLRGRENRGAALRRARFIRRRRRCAHRPMNKNAQDIMMGAPSTVEPKQLDELHIAIVGDVEE